MSSRLGPHQLRFSLIASIVAVMMMVVMVMMMPVVPVPRDYDRMAVVVMMVVLHELHRRLIAASAVLFIHCLQDRAGIGDRLKEVSVGIDVQHLRRRWERSGLS
jgi:hypothetical protein